MGINAYSFNLGLQKEQAVDSAESLLSFKVHKIYNKSHKCDAYHVCVIFYYSFMI
ncbi:hypothetical protein DO628_06505 [Salmonella enterica subsp. salamae]|uniref:Uncharacterized protein n=12 Tax=Salmonella enterica TaxID=28901 RepID=A0A344R2X7_SALER|nr:hypothetical protein [Salmonella enterica]EAA4081599.1 hypothetical protein [Salmonella enterica subsp. salamae serovar Sofia]ECG1421192.1 hypothetical protein [Salmonella enterica subsp. salamae str. CFSAN000559]ECI2498027.1 hypothetical protein [Salmonella enterica subsp. enterica serovar Enteritidis]ECI2511350.1 hypothetical protein [Salmonella enterica subsp. enterica serovar Paratyphi B]EDS8306779.1 hypothetical protein [Salmonella enterica subsp. enterica serovar Java]EDT7498204.1 hy